MEIGTQIKKIRELKNFTQEYMAEQLNISQSAYAKMEKDDSDLTISKIKKIAEILNIKVEDLINFNDKYIFNNYSKTENGFYINQASPTEKELYQNHIQSLEKENSFLKELINKLTNK